MRYTQGMDEIELLIDAHAGLDRLGPGGDAETRRAIGLTGLAGDGPLSIADLGCGAGASALVLADALPGRVTAVDMAPPFVERLRERAARAGLGDRIRAVVGRMESLPFRDGELDLIWSEGAIYNLGFDAGVRAWGRFLRPGGVLAVSELTWTTETRPEAITAHWVAEYPEVGTAPEKLRVLEQAGYDLLGHFVLPGECWTANYYEPLRRGFPAFLERHAHADAAREFVDAMEAEIRLYTEFGEWFGYGFFIARRPGAGA
jgi:SAM-dependent methyltransferase